MAATVDQATRRPPPPRQPRGRPSWGVAIAVGIPLAVVGLLVLLPLGLVGVYSFYTLNDITGLMQRDFSWSNYQILFERDIYRRVFFRSFEIAGLSTVVALIIGYPVGYALGTVADRRKQNILLLLVLVPFWSSYIVRTYAWIGILRTNGFLDDMLGWVPGLPTDSTPEPRSLWASSMSSSP
jgi:ABC-type spermidine/putrescine transport system permease subunit I